jgi:uncharacterized protein
MFSGHKHEKEVSPMVKADIAARSVSSNTETLPDSLFTQHIAALGTTGSGKTTAAKGFAERLMGTGRRICAIDPTGVWWGLRLMADGVGGGYPVVIFGGDHADIPLDEQNGAQLAHIIAAGTFSCVIDTSLMTVGGRTRLFTDFAEALFRANKRPLHLIIDEAHVFAPQGRVPDPQSGRMLHAANNLVSGGRSRGLRIMLISQRPAKLHKDSLTQVETLIAMRLIAPQDRAAVEAWIGEWADPKQGKEIITSLPSLARGEGWVWAPEAGMLERISFPAIKTFDSSRAPEDGEVQNIPGDLAAIDINSIRSALQTSKGTEKAMVIGKLSTAELDAAENRGFNRGYEKGFKAGRRVALEQATEALSALGVKPISIADEQTKAASRPSGEMRVAINETQQLAPSKGGAELRVLRVLAARHPARFTKAQWATLARMKRTGGTWANYVSLLRKAGYIDERDDTVGITAPGLVAAGSVERPAPGTVVHQWKEALGSGPAKMIDALIEAYPRQIDRANLADRVNMTATGGTFANYLSLLRTNGLVEVSGRKIKASSTLFVDAGEQAA